MEVCLCVSQRISILNNSTDINFFIDSVSRHFDLETESSAIITIPVLSSSVTDWLDILCLSRGNQF